MRNCARVDVVGAGIVGSAVAWRAARSGYRVRLFDPLLAEGAVQTGASWAAGGMLAPFSEYRPGEEAALALGAASLARWPGFASELRAESGIDVAAARGTLMVAADGADAEALRTHAEALRTHAERLSDPPGSAVPAAQDPLVAEPLTRAGVRASHPALAKNLRGGLWLPGEAAVDNRALLTALRTAAVRAGAEAAARSWDGAEARADHLVVTAGPDAAAVIPGLPVRPVKGEVLRLRRRPTVPRPPGCTVRAGVHGRRVYLVPRPDGLVVGATMYEHGDDQEVTVGGVRDLIADGQAVLPAAGEYAFAGAMAGLRPMTPDDLPIIGRLDGARTDPDMIAATGHGRNGVLLAPVTADAVLAELAGRRPADTECARPGRFGLGSRRIHNTEEGSLACR